MKALLTLLFLLMLTAVAEATVTCGTSDDTASIQAAIDAARTTYDAVAPMIPVQLPTGPCRVTSLDMTGRTGIALLGPSQIVPIADGVAVLDLTGSANIQIRDINICGQCNLSIIPSVGILVAQAAGALDGLSNKLLFDYVQVSGNYSTASLFVFGVPSSQIANSQFSNWHFITSVWTGNNFFGVQSKYLPLSESTTQMPTDWTIVGTEFHNVSEHTAIWIGGASDLRWYGGNASSNNTHVVEVHTVAGGHSPARIIFDGTTFYSDTGVQGPCAVFFSSVPTSAVHFRANAHSQPALTC